MELERNNGRHHFIENWFGKVKVTEQLSSKTKPRYAVFKFTVASIEAVTLSYGVHYIVVHGIFNLIDAKQLGQGSL